jgi:hypothetical protein
MLRSCVEVSIRPALVDQYVSWTEVRHLPSLGKRLRNLYIALNNGLS